MHRLFVLLEVSMLVTLREAAAELKISLNHAKNLVKAGQWPIYKISERIIRVDPEEIKQIARISVGERMETDK